MSALAPIADISGCLSGVRFVPIADMSYGRNVLVFTTERAMTSRRWSKLPSRPPTPFATVEQCACKQRMLNAAICDGAARGHVPRPKMGRGLSFDSIADDELGDLICCQVH